MCHSYRNYNFIGIKSISVYVVVEIFKVNIKYFLYQAKPKRKSLNR